MQLSATFLNQRAFVEPGSVNQIGEKIMTAAANQQQVETIQVVERLTYHSEESGYSVARLKLLVTKT